MYILLHLNRIFDIHIALLIFRKSYTHLYVDCRLENVKKEGEKKKIFGKRFLCASTRTRTSSMSLIKVSLRHHHHP